MFRLCLALTLLPLPLFGQDAVADGAHLFRVTCANCHGERGDMIVGVDLGHGQFKRASTDDDLVRIMMNGIPGTGMPPNTISMVQARSIALYLRSLAPGDSAPSGDSAHGKELFASKGCASCHRILGEGSRVGPDLSEVGSIRRPADLERSITDPDADIQPENRTFQATTNRGERITGRVIDEDAFGLRIIDSNEHLLALNRADLKESSFSGKSAMPSFRDKLSTKELTDLVSYLSSLKRMDAR